MADRSAQALSRMRRTDRDRARASREAKEEAVWASRSGPVAVKRMASAGQEEVTDKTMAADIVD